MPFAQHRLWLYTHGLSGARLVDSSVRPPIHADLRLAVLNGADWAGVDLGRADLRNAALVGANLRGITVRGDARQADLSRADLRDADLRGADLRGANLRGADLREAQVHGTRLDGAALNDAQLGGLILGGAILEDTMRDVQSRALASGGIEWVRSAIDDGTLDPAYLSANGEGLASTFIGGLPVGSRPADDPRAELLAAWLRPQRTRDWAGLRAAHSGWLDGDGGGGERLSARGSDLREFDLDGARLRWASLPQVELSATRFDGLDLRGVDLRGAHLRDVIWTNVRLDDALLDDVDLGRAQISGTAHRARWTGASVDQATLSLEGRPTRPALILDGPDHQGEVLTDADFCGADLRGADLRGAQLAGARFDAARLDGACFDSAFVGATPMPAITGLSARGTAFGGGRFADLASADLRGADLRGVAIEGTWRDVDLRGAVLLGADLRAAHFVDCDMRDTILHAAQVAGTRFEGGALAIHTLAAAALTPISMACAAVSTDRDALILDLKHMRPCAWRVTEDPIVHAWLITLADRFADLRTMTIDWLRGQSPLAARL
ncbi:MAG: hypothetical protein ACI9U2_001374 [Bradymonadia bacterium]|jgi:uncharacterized protein YjbI with pentapeptide repeats